MKNHGKEDGEMVKYFVSLTTNESEGLHEIEDTSNFQVPDELENFEVNGESLHPAVKVAIKKLQKIANDTIEIFSIDKEKDEATLIFSNCKDGLGLTYGIIAELD